MSGSSSTTSARFDTGERSIGEPMRVVVAGGPGFIAREVLPRLLASGRHPVAVTTRDPQRPDPWQVAVERIQAFAGDLSGMSRACARADVVVQAIQFPNHPVEN